MKFENSAQNIFKTYLSINAVQDPNTFVKSDVVNTYFTNKTMIKRTIKRFWREKRSLFYKEALMWKNLIALVTAQWIVLMIIGFSLIGTANYNQVGWSSSTVLAAKVIGSILLVLAALVNWGFIIFMLKRKPSFYHVMLKDTSIQKNLQAVMVFYGMLFTSLLAHAIFHAVLNEMILLSYYNQHIKDSTKFQQEQSKQTH